jgi:hypothetical protein
VSITQSSTGLMGMVKTVIANEQVQATGKTIIDGIPQLMEALDSLSKVHPFVQGSRLRN